MTKRLASEITNAPRLGWDAIWIATIAVASIGWGTYAVASLFNV